MSCCCSETIVGEMSYGEVDEGLFVIQQGDNASSFFILGNFQLFENVID